MQKREHRPHDDRARPGRKRKKQAPAPQTPEGPNDAPHRVPPVRTIVAICKRANAAALDAESRKLLR
jgi:hypothetical protein